MNAIAHLPGYRIGKLLYEDSRTSVYRAVRESDRLSVKIEVLRNPFPTFYELVKFRNSYAIAKNLHLHLTNIVNFLALEPYQNGYALVMEDFGGIPLKQYAQEHSLSLEEVLAIALQMAGILHDLCQHRVVHKDIKPANILIYPETKQIKLTDFSIASLLPKETQEIQNPNLLEGTLGYLAPEQTGRMNRGIDYRADFYALGVTLYELLTGELPFSAKDPLELVHCHISQLPVPPHQVNPTIPSMVSAIALKLMAKNAEDRYQSGLGLKYDLEHCLTQWQETGKVETFELGLQDRCDRFLIPERLYGREQEVQTLLDAFDRVIQGTTEMMLVAGFSGVGKTAVVNEVHKPIVRQRGYFIKGKFDQFNRNIPFSAFVQAFRSLMGQLLGESDADLANWKANILQAVGENGQVIINVIPELKQIIGKQPSIPELSGSAAQNRFNLLLGKFIRVFTTKEHPLVIFLDDLQWADSASLNLLKLLMNESEAGYLLVLGAYRNNEVFPAHPLLLTLDEIKKHGANFNTLTLAPLKEVDITHLVADTLLCETEIAAPLSQLVYQKTQGNPFFTTQFLQGLYQDGWIKFQTDEGYWQCDLSQVRQLALTDDVVAFIVGRLEKLPKETQKVLKLAACMGNHLDLATLSVICEDSQEEVAADLWRALQENFVIPKSETYKFFQGDKRQGEDIRAFSVGYRFLHDRVQQAAYSLIPDEQKQTTHYYIGRLLLQQIPLDVREKRIFELVSQLNYGSALITEQSDRDELAQLNLIACRKARSATAYQAGLEYTNTGLSLLGENAWQRQYEMSLEFHNLGAELASLCGDFKVMKEFIETVIAQANSLLEKINVYQSEIFSNVSQNKPIVAIAIAQQLLQQLGVSFAQTPTQKDIQHSITEIKQLIGDREIADLGHLPLMTDGKKIAILRIINSIIPAAHFSGSLLYPLLVTLSVKLSIQYGNTSASAFAYSAYGILVCDLLQNVDTGVKFGQLALQVVSQLDAKAIKPMVLQVVGVFILHRKSHIKKTLPLAQEGYAAGLEVGNLEWVGYNAHEFCLHSFWCGQPLDILEQEARAYCQGLEQLNQLTAANWCRIHWQVTLNLFKVVKHPSILSGEALQRVTILSLLTTTGDFVGLFFFHLYELMLCYLFGEIGAAKERAVEVKRYLMPGKGTVCEPAFYFYDSLTALATLDLRFEERSGLIQQVEQNKTKLQQWAYYAPMNHQHKVDLVAAEKCRVLGQQAEAIELYDKAIAGTKANEYIQEEALANELAAKFYLNWGKEKVAAVYMQEAYYCYARWGAKAKIEDLENRYPNLLQPILMQTVQNVNPLETIAAVTEYAPRATATPNFSLHTSPKNSTTSGNNINTALDFAAVLKACRSLSLNIQLDELLRRLTQIILQNSGGDRCIIILPNRDGVWQIKAVATPETTKLYSQPLEGNTSFPIKLIQYVKNTQEIVTIDDLNTDLAVIDEYLNQQQPKSLLCLPLVDRGQSMGILYLGNQSTSGVFTSDRILVLNFICTKAAICLKNASLYSNLQASEARYQRLANNVPGVIYQFRMTPNGYREFTYISSGCYEMFEMQPEELLADIQVLLSRIHSEDVAEFEHSVALSAQTLQPWQWEGRFILPSERVKWIRGGSRPERQVDGSIVWDGMLIDISDRQRLEQALKTANANLEIRVAERTAQLVEAKDAADAASRAKSIFLANMSHELRTPLNSILGFSQLMAQDAQLLDKHLEGLRTINHSGRHLLTLIDDILEMSKIAAGRVTLNRVNFSLPQLLDSLKNILQFEAESKRLTFTISCQPQSPLYIQTDSQKLHQILINLLGNAIKFTNKGTVALRVSSVAHDSSLSPSVSSRIDEREVTNDREQMTIRFEVEDSGCGIAPEELDLLFEPFVQTTSGRLSQQGTGLGLPLSREFVHLMGGELEVTSQPGIGSTFSFEIPVKVVDTATEEVFPSLQQAIPRPLGLAIPSSEMITSTASDLAALPDDLIQNLNQAALNLDLKQLNKAISKVRQYNNQLADRIAMLVSDYRFAKLQELLSSND